MENEPTVIIGIPVSDSNAMNANTAQSIGAAIIGAGTTVENISLRQSCDIASNRTWLVNDAIEKGATHLLFVDCDMIFPQDVIPRLLAHKKEIIAVEYNKREFPLKGTFEPLTERHETEPYKAKYAGMGVMLIDLSIFKDPKFGVDSNGNTVPWFAFGRDSQGNLAMTEDSWFCFLARDAGYDTWIDPTIRVGHLGYYTY